MTKTNRMRDTRCKVRDGKIRLYWRRMEALVAVRARWYIIILAINDFKISAVEYVSKEAVGMTVSELIYAVMRIYLKVPDYAHVLQLYDVSTEAIFAFYGNIFSHFIFYKFFLFWIFLNIFSPIPIVIPRPTVKNWKTGF